MTDAYAEAGSQIADLIGRFVEEVGGLRRDAQVATDSARAEYVDASRLRQEAMKLRADAEAEATRIMDDARSEADRIRVEAEAEAAEAKRVVGEVVDDIERAQRSLAELIGKLGSDDEPKPSDGVLVVPNAPSKDLSES